MLDVIRRLGDIPSRLLFKRSSAASKCGRTPQRPAAGDTEFLLMLGQYIRLFELDICGVGI